MTLVDGTSGGAVSGLTVTDGVTGESHVSTCGAISFSQSPGHAPSFLVSAGTGTDCSDSSSHAYVSVTQTETGPGNFTITVTRSANTFTDTFTEASPPVNLETHTPDVGISWIKISGQAAVNPSGQATPSNNATKYKNNPVPASADCHVAAFIKYNSVGGGAMEIFARADATLVANSYSCFVAGLSGNVFLISYVAGAQNVIAGPFAAPTIGNNKLFELDCTGNQIVLKINGATVATVTNNDHAAAGISGFQYSGGGADNMALLSFVTG